MERWSSSHFTGILRGARFFSKTFSQKSWGTFKISREMAHSVIWPARLGIYSWLLKKFTNISLGSHNFKSIDDIFTLNFYCMWLQLSWHGHWGLIVDRSFIFADFFIRSFSSLYFTLLYFHKNILFSQVVRASGCQCQSCNCPLFDPSILQHSGIWGAADEAVLNNVHLKKKQLS
jgi:hypothetical protein